jgi:7,8-dihydroneopterin aldolase/epimerase/oxygenase
MAMLEGASGPFPGPEEMSHIRISGLRVVATHGALPEERERPQPFVVDLFVNAHVPDAARTDALADTVDYGTLVSLATEVLTTRSFTLLEAAAAAVADALVAADERIVAANVTVTKVRPPLPYDVGSVAVSASRNTRRAQFRPHFPPRPDAD